MRPLFTSNSDAPRSLKRVALAVLMAVAALVLCDGISSLVIHWITREPPELLPIVTDTVGIDALWRFKDAGLSPVVFTGSSQTTFGISPHTFEDTTATLIGQVVPSVNIGIPTSDTIMLGQLIRSLIIPQAPAQSFMASKCAS